MTDDRDYNPQPGTGIGDNDDRDRTEQFNELSETSLEERMAVADRLGIPAGSVGEAAATGTISGTDNAGEGPDDGQEAGPAGDEMNR